MDLEFDIENEHYYEVNGEYDCSSDSNQSYFFDFNEMLFDESNLKSMHERISPQCDKTNDVLNPKPNFLEKSHIKIGENPIEKISIQNNKSKTLKIKTKKKKNPLMTFQKNSKKSQKFNICYNYTLPNVNATNPKGGKVYQTLFMITGAYLTQSELTYLRNTLFSDIMPIMNRDEQRSKIKNIERFEKYQDKIIPILLNPNIKGIIQNYLFSRRRDYEKMDMIENLYINIRNES